MIIKKYQDAALTFDLRQQQYQLKASQRTQDDFTTEEEYLDWLIDCDEDIGAGTAYAEAKRLEREVFGHGN